MSGFIVGASAVAMIPIDLAILNAVLEYHHVGIDDPANLTQAWKHILLRYFIKWYHPDS